MAEKTAEVIPMPGLLIQCAKGEPVADVVMRLESFLEKAKRGELIGVAIAGILWDGNDPREYAILTAFERSGGHNTSLALDAAINKLARRYAHYMDG